MYMSLSNHIKLNDLIMYVLPQNYLVELEPHYYLIKN